MQAKIVRANLKEVVKAYRQATGQSMSQVSRKFYGNTQFLDLFFAGQHSISIDRLEEMVDAFIAAWPDGAKWPALRGAFFKSPERRK